MAEIRVEEKRRSLAWLWVVLALAVAALAYWWFTNDGVNQVDVQPTGMAPAVEAPVASRGPAMLPALAA